MSSISWTHRVDRYADAVLSGETIAGPLVRLACERHRRDRQRADDDATWYQFSAARADKVIEFIESCLRLPDMVDEQGEPKRFLLTPWQTFVVGSMFGWIDVTQRRRFREGYIETGKGSGKTPVLASLGLYGLTLDGARAAEIYAAGADQDQAMILLRDAVRIAQASPDLNDPDSPVLEYDGGAHIWQIRHPASGSFFRTFSRESGQKSGTRPMFGLCDELHEHGSPQTTIKIRAGAKRWPQPVFLEITNSGYDRTSICWQRHEHARRVMEQVVEDDQFFCYVCALDDGDDPIADEGCWIKTNPNLGVSITHDYLRRQVSNAKNIPSEMNNVLRLNFCVWTQAVSRYFDAVKWRECATTIPDDELIGVPCVAGLDLGQSDDFSAFVRIWDLSDGRIAVKAKFWLPRAAMEKFPHRPYRQWERDGALTITDGNTTDYETLEADILAECRRSGVRQLAYDKRFAEQLAQRLIGAGVECVDTPQGFYMNAAIRRLNEWVINGDLCHGGNAVLNWMADNAVVKVGRDQAIRLDKDSARDKIDGIAALAMATDRLMKQVAVVETKSVYATGGGVHVIRF